jgi:hypothetical protein
MAIYHSGNSLLGVNGGPAIETGFPVSNRSTGEYTIIKHGSEFFKLSGGQNAKPLGDIDNPHELHGEIHRLSRKGDRYGIVYDDPWKILQGYSLATMMDSVNCELGAKPGKFINRLKLLVWHGNKLRLQDKIPSRLIPNWNGKETEVRFTEIGSHDIKMSLLYQRTFWGRRLVELAHRPETELWAKRLQKKLDYFLRGLPHPSWKKEDVVRIYETNDVRDRKSRSSRLLECLKTVEGIFLQRYLAFPNEEWTWEKFDLLVLKYLTILLDDEFLDGNLRPEVLGYRSRYSELKAVRKTFKRYALSSRDEYFKTSEFEKSIPVWLKTFVPIYRSAINVKGTVWSCAIRSTLSQTRGMGTPPPIVVYQSKEKFLRKVTEIPAPLTEEEKELIKVSINNTIKGIPEHVFSGLRTKAAITLTASACWEKTREEGGTLQAISDLLVDARSGRQANVIDLNTGKFLYSFTYERTKEGEYIFWRCLEEVLSHDPKEISKVFVAVVKEPGKARTITKGSAYLKVILDTVNKIVSYPLTKVETSVSGMSKDAHGWNFFQDFFKEENKEISFHGVVSDDRSPDGRHITRLVQYDALWVECTDYTDATNAMNHEVAKLLSDSWLKACGIPRVLKRIIDSTCFTSRVVVFNGSGIFSKIGEPDEPGTTLRRVVLEKGIMMGDPLTKVLLHNVNISVRKLGRYISDGSYKELVLDNPVPLMSEMISIEPFSIADRDLPRYENTLDGKNILPSMSLLPKTYRPKVELSQGLRRLVQDWEQGVRRKTPNYLAISGIGLILKDGNKMVHGYIPKAIRNTERLLSVRDPVTGELLSYKEANPEDYVLQMEGYRPVNPITCQEITSESDMLQALEDFRTSKGWSEFPTCDIGGIRYDICHALSVENFFKMKKNPKVHQSNSLFDGCTVS